MGGTKQGEGDKDQPGHGIFAYRTKDDKTWRLHMTMSSTLRTTLEGYSAREWIIMREFYKTGRVPSDYPGMCFEKDLRRKVEEFGALDLKWRDDQKGLFPLNMTGRLKMTSHLRKLEPLADALEHSRTTLAEKEAAQEEKLANRKVVKMPGVAKPADWKPYVPPAPKEKKERGPIRKDSMRRKERLQRLADVDYGRPYTKRRRRRDPDDAEEGEVL